MNSIQGEEINKIFECNLLHDIIIIIIIIIIISHG